MTWHDMTWHNMTLHDMTWSDMIWYDMVWYNMSWYDIWCAVWYMIKDMWFVSYDMLCVTYYFLYTVYAYVINCMYCLTYVMIRYEVLSKLYVMIWYNTRHDILRLTVSCCTVLCWFRTVRCRAVPIPFVGNTYIYIYVYT